MHHKVQTILSIAGLALIAALFIGIVVSSMFAERILQEHQQHSDQSTPAPKAPI